MRWEFLEIEKGKFYYMWCLTGDEWHTVSNALLHSAGTLTDDDDNIIVDIPEIPGRREELQKWHDDMMKLYGDMEGPPEHLKTEA